MKKKLYLPGMCLALMGLMGTACSNDEPADADVKNVDTNQEVVDRQDGQKEDNGLYCGDWAPIEWEVRSTSGNPVVSFTEGDVVGDHKIILTAPGGSLELVANNYEWPGLHKIQANYGFAGNEYEEGRAKGIAGKNYNIHCLGNVLTCEFFDIPASFSGDVVAFTVSAGDRFESFRVSVAPAQ